MEQVFTTGEHKDKYKYMNVCDLVQCMQQLRADIKILRTPGIKNLRLPFALRPASAKNMSLGWRG